MPSLSASPVRSGESCSTTSSSSVRITSGASSPSTSASTTKRVRTRPSGTSSRFHGLSRRAAAFTQSPFSVGFITTTGVLLEACCAKPFLVRTRFVNNPSVAHTTTNGPWLVQVVGMGKPTLRLQGHGEATAPAPVLFPGSRGKSRKFIRTAGNKRGLAPVLVRRRIRSSPTGSSRAGARPIAQRESQRIGRLAREDCPQVIDEHTHTGRSAQLDAMDEEHPPRRGAPRWKQEVKRAAFDLVAHQPIGEQRDAGS